jgi:hypothetical protein
MRSELGKTALFVAAALLLVVIANWVEPEAARPEIFSDQGEPLFPQFRDVMAVKAIEVVDYDETQAVARPLKVEFRKGRWVLPSHNDYPAEAADRLAKTSAALLDLHKDLVVSDRIEDHAAYGVIDPLDMNATSLAGRGKRVTLRDEQGEVLADMVLGKAVPEHEGYRYARMPGQKRIYGVKTDADPSAGFADWVEANLLRISSDQLRKITVNSYSVDETWGRVRNLEQTVLTRQGDNWTGGGARKPGKSAIQAAVDALSSIRIAGARPKPRPLAEQLRRGRLEMTLEAVMSLRQRGFFLTPTGQLLANEGEVLVETSQGLRYTLRFGEIVSGAADTPTGGESEQQDTAEQDRYMFVMVSHDPSGAAGGERLAETLTRKFADWYYVISGEDFNKLRLKR